MDNPIEFPLFETEDDLVDRLEAEINQLSVIEEEIENIRQESISSFLVNTLSSLDLAINGIQQNIEESLGIFDE